jgi:hypothetical protein
VHTNDKQPKSHPTKKWWTFALVEHLKKLRFERLNICSLRHLGEKGILKKL